MQNSPLDYWANILGIIASMMTILGVGGIVTWSFINRGRSFSDRVLIIFGYSTKLGLCIILSILLGFIGLAFFMLTWSSIDIVVQITLSSFGSNAYDYSVVGGPTFWVSIILVGVFLIPAFFLVWGSVLTWSFAPIERFLSRTFQKKPAPDLRLPRRKRVAQVSSSRRDTAKPARSK